MLTLTSTEIINLAFSISGTLLELTLPTMLLIYFSIQAFKFLDTI